MIMSLPGHILVSNFNDDIQSAHDVGHLEQIPDILQALCDPALKDQEIDSCLRGTNSLAVTALILASLSDTATYGDLIYRLRFSY